jgi:CRP-like cAMP-binding protein
LNNLLQALKESDFRLLEPHFRRIVLKVRQVLYHPGDAVHSAYFPTDSAVIAFRVVLDEGRSIETCHIGREGAVGIVSSADLPAYAEAVAQHEGPVLQIDLDQLETAKAKEPRIAELFARYADCLIAQVFQSVACNAVHTIQQRAAKWIISATERSSDNLVRLTQQDLGESLGVSRVFVNRVLQNFKNARVIEISRGHLIVTNTEGLRKYSCRCNESVRHHFDEVLTGVYRSTWN